MKQEGVVTLECGDYDIFVSGAEYAPGFRIVSSPKQTPYPLSLGSTFKQIRDQAATLFYKINNFSFEMAAFDGSRIESDELMCIISWMNTIGSKSVSALRHVNIGLGTLYGPPARRSRYLFGSDKFADKLAHIIYRSQIEAKAWTLSLRTKSVFGAVIPGSCTLSSTTNFYGISLERPERAIVEGLARKRAALEKGMCEYHWNAWSQRCVFDELVLVGDGVKLLMEDLCRVIQGGVAVVDETTEGTTTL